MIMVISTLLHFSLNFNEISDSNFGGKKINAMLEDEVEDSFAKKTIQLQKLYWLFVAIVLPLSYSCFF